MNKYQEALKYLKGVYYQDSASAPIVYYYEDGSDYKKSVDTLQELVEKHKKALDKACKLIADYSGSCPLDSYDINLDCEDRCESNTKDCWKAWCLQDE